MKREHLYVKRKHPCVWLMVLCMAASSILRIVQFSGNIWLGMVFPIVAAVVYVLIAVFSGDEMLYRTAVPVWVLGLCAAIPSGSVLIWLASLLFCFCYTQIISGKAKKIWLLPLCLLALRGCIYMHSFADTLFVVGLLLLWPAIKVHNDGKRYGLEQYAAAGGKLRTKGCGK